MVVILSFAPSVERRIVVFMVDITADAVTHRASHQHVRKKMVSSRIPRKANRSGDAERAYLHQRAMMARSASPLRLAFRGIRDETIFFLTCWWEARWVTASAVMSTINTTIRRSTLGAKERMTTMLTQRDPNYFRALFQFITRERMCMAANSCGTF